MFIKLVEDFDNDHNELSDSQERYFRNSKLRTNGKLMIFYRGETSDKPFRTEFHCEKYPYFFSELKEYSEEYGDINLCVYLNITNPFSLRTKTEYDIINIDFRKYCEENNIVPLGIDDIKIGKLVPFPLVDTLYYYLRDNTDYDGMLAEEYSESTSYYSKWGTKGQISYIPFFSNQIKLVTNKNPTDTNNIGE